jgi:hypothetical protein
MNGPANEIHPRKGGSEREPGNDGVERLGLKLAGNSHEGIGSSFCRHFIVYIDFFILVTIPLQSEFFYIFGFHTP